MKLVVGLGNPGPEYERTRHNLGFLTLDAFLGQRRKFTQEKVKHGVGVSLSVGGETKWLVKPMTFMNRSGQAVLAAARQLKVEPSDVLIVHDDLDLEEGRLQIKRGGGTAGNKGLESIVQTWGLDDFYRLRIGIGRPENMNSSDYVLEEVSEELLDGMAERAAEALQLIFNRGPVKAMNIVNVRESKEGP